MFAREDHASFQTDCRAADNQCQEVVNQTLAAAGRQALKIAGKKLHGQELFHMHTFLNPILVQGIIQDPAMVSGQSIRSVKHCKRPRCQCPRDAW